MMRVQIPTDIVSRALLSTATLLLLIIVFEVAAIMAGPPPADPALEDGSTLPPAVSASGQNTMSYPPLGEFKEILQRPVYELTRRPVQVRKVVSDNASADRLRQKWRLSGIIIDENNIAILETQRAGETLSLIEGQSLDGWRVREISENGVVLIRGGEALQFVLHDESANGQVNNRNRRAQTWKPSEN